MKRPVCVLTIAGSDSGAGAGVQADARAIHALGGYALTVITAVTAQNTRGIAAWEPVSPRVVESQLRAVLDDFPVAAIKTGLLPSASMVHTIARVLDEYPKRPLIIDPVMGSTSGSRFLDADGIRLLKKKLLPRATLVTPNWPEAETLSGIRIESLTTARMAAQRILECGVNAVLIKGGHGPGDTCRDLLMDRAGRARVFSAKRIQTRNTHGTGCVLSAAITTAIARGNSLETAIGMARRLLRKGLRAGRAREWGGTGPAFDGVSF